MTAWAVFFLWQLSGIAYPVRDHAIEITPPLTITEDEVDRAVELLARPIDATASRSVRRASHRSRDGGRERSTAEAGSLSVNPLGEDYDVLRR